MSDTAKKLFESIRTEANLGTSRFGQEVKAELSRLGTQGAMELASALFNGSGFVPYGPGQYTPSVEQDGPEQAGPELDTQENEQGSQEMERER